MLLDKLPQALLRTFVRQIAPLLLDGAKGDIDAARHAAAVTLASYDPYTEAELRLAARIISFSLQAGEALAQAANPEMPMTRVLRLRSGAVSLSREAEKAERRLEKLRAARRQGLPEPLQPPAQPDVPAIQATTDLIEENRSVAAYAEAHGVSFTEALKQRHRMHRLAARAHKQQTGSSAA